jgi:hypothetical protein
VASRDALVLPDEADVPQDDPGRLHAEVLVREAEAALARAKAIENSTIWRLTAPLRRLIDLTRGRAA